jgi:hypothetical protein
MMRDEAVVARRAHIRQLTDVGSYNTTSLFDKEVL